MTTPPSQTHGEMPGEIYIQLAEVCHTSKARAIRKWDYVPFDGATRYKADLAESRGSSPEWLQAIGKMLLEDLLTINLTDNARPIHFLILKELYDEIRLAKKALPLPPSERCWDE